MITKCSNLPSMWYNKAYKNFPSKPTRNNSTFINIFRATRYKHLTHLLTQSGFIMLQVLILLLKGVYNALSFDSVTVIILGMSCSGPMAHYFEKLWPLLKGSADMFLSAKLGSTCMCRFVYSDATTCTTVNRSMKYNPRIIPLFCCTCVAIVQANFTHILQDYSTGIGPRIPSIILGMGSANESRR